MKNGEQPAFPLLYDGDKAQSFCHDGLTKREYFTAMAMQGILASRYKFDSVVISPTYSDLANYAIRYADELLKQLDPEYSEQDLS